MDEREKIYEIGLNVLKQMIELSQKSADKKAIFEEYIKHQWCELMKMKFDPSYDGSNLYIVLL